MDLIEKEMLEFREQFLSSKPAATLTELRAQMIKPGGAQMKGQTVLRCLIEHVFCVKQVVLI